MGEAETSQHQGGGNSSFLRKCAEFGPLRRQSLYMSCARASILDLVLGEVEHGGKSRGGGPRFAGSGTQCCFEAHFSRAGKPAFCEVQDSL